LSIGAHHFPSIPWAIMSDRHLLDACESHACIHLLLIVYFPFPFHMPSGTYALLKGAMCIPIPVCSPAPSPVRVPARLHHFRLASYAPPGARAAPSAFGVVLSRASSLRSHSYFVSRLDVLDAPEPLDKITTTISYVSLRRRLYSLALMSL
jgi:hypothetical protein